MSKILNKHELSRLENMSEYGCNYKELLDYYEYLSNITDYSDLSNGHIDLIDRTNSIIYESRNNLLATIDYLSDKGKSTIDLVINDIIPLIESCLDNLESDHEKDIQSVTIKARNKIKDIVDIANLAIINEQEKHKLTTIQLEEYKAAKIKGGSYSPYKHHENKIITLIDLYRESQSSLSHKQTHQELTEEIMLNINQKVNVSTVKKWWANYKSSDGVTIFKQG